MTCGGPPRSLEPAPPLQRWQVGGVRITAVLETADALDPDFVTRVVLPSATPDALSEHRWLAPHYVDAHWRPLMVVQALVVESEGRCLLVDTCIGDAKPRRNPAFRLRTPFLARLRAAGVPPQRVDALLCTHLHFDHVGWNTRLCSGQWVPTFPRARALIAAAEWARFAAQPRPRADFIEDSVQPLLDAELVDWVQPGHAVTAEVSLQPTPGHTPGHLSVRVRSQGSEAWITGDLLHHPCQLAHPEWTSPADDDPAQARRTRERFLAEVEQSGALIIGTHFPAPSAGRVTECAPAYRLRPAP